ncbi:peptide chain release factor-like protein [Stieleria sp. TO1_6]|uniref:peptide chain release factor family protein n=1 Tax=Stieleria tagensis TaxID=2956795 RepID=UPI00209B41C3|nr:peptide chain release factor-like protein [Stieleria tagensis]MCO8121900.1 peptide chain release factor-like protein [Stieleria tagensis]
MSSKPSAVIPDADARLDCRFVAAPHPSVIGHDRLLAECDLRTQRRSGPGGQHRNKTSSGAYLTHRPSGLVGEATERRSQAQNRDVAFQRLRYLLAVELRTPSPLDLGSWKESSDEAVIRKRYRGHSLRLNETNADKPSLLAMVMNDLWVSGGQPSLLVDQWATSTSKLVALIRSFPPALVWVNQVRRHHQRLPLH